MLINKIPCTDGRYLHQLVKGGLVSILHTAAVDHTPKVGKDRLGFRDVLCKLRLSFGDRVGVAIATGLAQGKATQHGVQWT